jgi:hypothetical protein
LVRILSEDEVLKLGFKSGAKVLKIITARDMNSRQRKIYNNQRGCKR